MQHGPSVIVDYVRTPFAKASLAGSGKKPGQFADIDPVDMMVPLVNALIDRTGVDPKAIKNVLTGAAHQEFSMGLNIARLVALHKDSKLDPNVTGGTTMDRFCGSSMEAVAVADAFLARNPEHVYLCTGVQTMSQVPMGGSNPSLNAGVHAGNVSSFMDMGTTAERLAELYGITRLEQDQFAVDSHKKAAAGQESGHYSNEIIPLGGIALDDGVRADSTLQSLARLKPAFKAQESGGTVTAATSSQVTDGATAMLVTSEAYATKNNLPIKARILAFGEAALAPEIMGLGPVEASLEALNKAGLKMEDIGAVELNEAFAAQSIAVLKEFANRGAAIDPSKLNVDGGAIAIGHPLGASGIRIVGHVMETLIRENKQYGLATMCIGGGQGVAMVIENAKFTPKLT